MITRRRFCRVAGRWMHDRSAGRGPTVIALHGSPQSSTALATLIEACAQRGLHVIAPDTPGNGLSDPLASQASMQDYAAHLKAWMDALGIERAAVYGFHTGAAIAASLALHAPHAVSALLLDGLPCWTKKERSDLLSHYLPAFTPHWDGSHLAWSWARMEEQSIFFPWYAQTETARLADYAIAAPTHLHANVLDLFKAGDNYRRPYRAAFDFDAAPVLAALTHTSWITAAPNDPLCAHLARMTGGTRIKIAAAPADRAARMDAFAHYLSTHADASTDDASPSEANADGERRGYIALAGGEIGFRADGPAALLWLHDAGASCQAPSPAGTLRIDLPGHGEAGAEWNAIPDDYRALADCLKPAVDAFDVRAISGVGLGARIAAALRGATSAPIVDAPPPDLSPRWDGAHLITAWRYLRRRAIYAPWNQPIAAHYRDPMGALDPGPLQAQLLDLFLCEGRLACAYHARGT